MPVSSTATTMPSPLKGEVSAPTACTPQVTVWAAMAAPLKSNGATRRMGMAGAMASTPASRVSRGMAWRSMTTDSDDRDWPTGPAALGCRAPAPRQTSRVARLLDRKMMCLVFMVALPVVCLPSDRQESGRFG